MYSGGEFPYPLQQDSVTQLYVTVVESQIFDVILNPRKINIHILTDYLKYTFCSGL